MGGITNWCPQGSILCPSLFNIYLNDLFYAVEDTNICNFVDDTTLYAGRFNLNDVMTDIEHDCSILVEQFQDNYLRLTADKCHLIISGYNYELMYAKKGDALSWAQ